MSTSESDWICNNVIQADLRWKYLIFELLTLSDVQRVILDS